MLQPFRPRSSGLTGLALVFVLFFAPSFLFAEPQSGPVMQAQTWEPDMDIRGWWMSEKLDGVRGYWTGEQLVSRSGNVFATPAWFTENFPSVPLDGEL